MERQIKKAGNFVPRLFKAFSLYLIMTLCVFFGYIQIFGKMESGPITLPILGASAEEENYFADFVQSFSKFKNVDANFDVTVKNGNINFSAKDSRVAFDMENQEFAFESLLSYNSQKFSVAATYVDSCLHLSLNEKNYKFDTSNVSDIDMSGVLNFALNTININTDEILSKVSAIIGLDLTNIDSTTILSVLKPTAEALDDGSYKFNIKLGKLEALLYCDEDFNITSAKAQHSTLGGISLIADVNEMNSDDFAIEFEQPENEIELNSVMEYVSYAKELSKKDIVSVDLSVNVLDETYSGTLTVDKTDKLKVKFELNQGVNASIVYVDDVVYAQIENVKVKFDVNDYNKFKDAIDKTIQNVTSKTTKEFITSIIEKLFEKENSNIEDFDVKNFVSDIISKLNVNDVITYLPDEAVMTDNQYTMLWNNGLSVGLTQKNGVLDGAKIEYTDFSISADIYDGNAVEFDNQGYYDIASLLPIIGMFDVKNIMTYIDGGIYEFDFAVEYNGLIFDGTFKYFENKMEISVLDLFGENLYVNIQDNYVFVNYANMKFKVAIPQNHGSSNFDLTEILNALTSDKLGVDIDFGGLKPIIDILSNYTTEDYIENLGFVVSEDEILITLNYNGKVFASFVVNPSEDGLPIINVNCSVLSGNVTINYVEESSINTIVADEYENYTTDIVDGLLDSFKVSEGIYSFSTDLAVRYSTNQFYGNLVGLLVKDESHEGLINGYIPAVALYTDSLGLDSYIYLVDNTVYVSIAGLQVYADINETTINDIMDLASRFTSIEVAETVDAFRIMLPSLTEIYGQWVYEITEESQSKIGVQVDIKDSLYYTSQARFYNIVAKVIMQKDDNRLLPSDVTIGANIDDPNTKLNENGYKDYLLTKNGSLIEDYELTGNLNFAVYLYNLTAGSVSKISDTFVISKEGKLEGFVINNVVTNVSDFSNYSDLLPMLSAYDYLTSYNYELGLSGNIASENQVITINEETDITVEINKLTDETIFDNEDEDIGEKVLSWFDDNYLKVLGDIDVNIKNLQDNSDVKHKLSVYYESDDFIEENGDLSGIYLTYSHGNLIGNKEFNGKIENDKLSTFISIIVSLMGIEMSDSAMASWGLEPCTTDFRYLQELLNIDTSKNEDNSSVDDVLQTVSNITNILDSIKLETSEKDEEGNFTTALVINLRETLGENASIKLVVLNNDKDGVVTSELNKLVVSSVSVGGMTINLEISFDEFKKENFDYDTSKEHIDLSNMTDFLDSLVNTLNQRTFNYSGAAVVNIGSYAINVDFDVEIKSGVDGIEVHAEIFPEATYAATYSLVGNDKYTGKNYYKRVSTVDLKKDETGEMRLYVTQNTIYEEEKSETVGKISSSKYKKHTYVYTTKTYADTSYTMAELGENVITLVSQVLGLTDLVAGIMEKITFNPQPTIEEAILNCVTNGDHYILSVNGANLTGVDSFSNFDVNLGVSNANDCVVTGGDLTKAFSFIDSIAIDEMSVMNIVKIKLNMSSNSGTSYRRDYIQKLGEYYTDWKGSTTSNEIVDTPIDCTGHTFYTNQYYRNVYLQDWVKMQEEIALEKQQLAA